MTSRALHLNLDDAWRDEPFGLPVADARPWGPRLSFSAPPRLVAEFSQEHEANLAARFLLYGSGDFHYLTALRLGRIAEPIVLVSFDNHPDWDVRPPRWCCGAWVNRALEFSYVQHVAVWGCGNFECWWPHQIFGNRRAERAGILEVHPWADDRPAKDRQRRGAILRDDWREHFEPFVSDLRGASVYVTIDLDCLRGEEAVTNWEGGRFTIADLLWSLGKLCSVAQIVAGDICGAFSEPVYARWKQRFASEMDHPKLTRPDSLRTREINQAAFEALWPALTH